MRTVEASAELRSLVMTGRQEGKRVGLVPTMGALHEGHLSLLRAGRSETDLLVMSLYVNPTQFGAGEDFAKYPRDSVRDANLAEAAGVDILFAPTDVAMYPFGVEAQTVWVDPGNLGQVLEGAYRPGHFRGVTTVVAKLFNMVQPDIAYFGQKDAQQAIVIQRMAVELNLPLEIRIGATVRESDGLALSSRNVFLSPTERSQAGAIYRGLTSAQQSFMAGERDANAIKGIVQETIAHAAESARIQYIAVTDAETLEEVKGRIDRRALLSLAVFFGQTRLIDNVILTPPD